MNWFELIEKQEFTKKQINKFLSGGHGKPNRWGDLTKFIVAVSKEDKKAGGVLFNWIKFDTLSDEMLKRTKDDVSPKEIKADFFKPKVIPFFLETHGKHGKSAGEGIMNQWVRGDMTDDAVERINRNLEWMGAPKITFVGKDGFEFFNDEHIKTYHEAMGFKEEVKQEPTNVMIIEIKSDNPENVFKPIPPEVEGDKYKINFYTKHPLYSKIKTAIKEYN